MARDVFHLDCTHSDGGAARRSDSGPAPCDAEPSSLSGNAADARHPPPERGRVFRPWGSSAVSTGGPAALVEALRPRGRPAAVRMDDSQDERAFVTSMTQTTSRNRNADPVLYTLGESGFSADSGGQTLTGAKAPRDGGSGTAAETIWTDARTGTVPFMPVRSRHAIGGSDALELKKGVVAIDTI